MFSKYQQERDWRELMEEIDNAPAAIGCGSYPDLFYADGNVFTEVRAAKQICQSCPVQRQCAIYALKWEDEGIWGGLTARERMVMRYKAEGKTSNKKYLDMPNYRSHRTKASDQKAS